MVVDPRHVFDANIFYPHRGTLAYSENNLGAGALAIPMYWATRNPYAAHNFVMLLAFVLSAAGMYYLVRYLTGDRRAAAISAIGFAFCPFVFAHTAHIQLLMTAGLPFTIGEDPKPGDYQAIAKPEFVHVLAQNRRRSPDGTDIIDILIRRLRASDRLPKEQE